MAPEHGPMRMNTGMHEFGRIDNTVARARGSGPRMRCLLGMLGMDIHTKGIRTLARQLRDRGVEIVYVGEHNTVDGLVRTAIVEDVDVIGLSFSVSSYLQQVAALMNALRAAEAVDLPVMVGGLIHPDHEAELKALGVAGVFGPGTTVDDVMSFLLNVSSNSSFPGFTGSHEVEGEA